MNIELKKFQHYPELSEETLAYSAEMYVGNVKVASCKNSGKGGSTEIRPYPGKKEIVQQAQEYAESLPDKEYELMGQHFSVSSTLETYVNDKASDLIKKNLIEKLQKKNFVLKKDENLFTVELPTRYNTMTKMLKVDGGKEYLRLHIRKYIKEGYTLLNTNIPEDCFPEI